MSLTRSMFASSNAATGRAARRLLINPLLIGICIVFCSASRLRASEDDRPHIVVIMADDLGFADLGCYGSEIETPRLDELAGRGVRMSQFYNTAKCHSSRVALLTGMYCDQAGSTSLSRGTTIARELKQAGYFTAMTGKWHLNQQPTDHGFDRYFGHLSGATNYFRGDQTFRLNGQPFDDFPEDFYTTVANTDYAIQFVNEALETEQPLFLYVAHNAPHYPLHARQEDFEKYRGRYDDGWDEIRQRRYAKQVELGLLDPKTAVLSARPDHVPAWETLSAEDQRWESERMAAYAGMVDCLDQQIGRLVDHLDSRGILENTLLLFVSDNGACPFERTRGRDRPPYDPDSYWTYDTGWAHVGNTPFRFYKQNSHEGGISSPAILHWSARMKAQPGSIDRQPAHLIDVMATCLEAARADYPSAVGKRAIQPLMGRSLIPILENGHRQPHPYLYFQFGPNRGLRAGDWKVVSYRGGPWELYDIAQDRSETEDLVEAKPERAEQMVRQWFEVAREVDHLPKKLLRPAGDRPQPGPLERSRD